MTHWSWARLAPRSSEMAGSAALTTVESRNATPDPRTAATMIQRPLAVPSRTDGPVSIGGPGGGVAMARR